MRDTGDHKKGEIEIKKENIVFQNGFATIYNDDVIFPSGAIGKYIRFCWNAPYGVSVLPITKDNKIALIESYRHEERGWSLSTPSGFGEPYLSEEESAAKELREETGYQSKNLEKIGEVKDNGYVTHLYIARDLEFIGTDIEEGEAISGIHFFSKSEAEDLMSSGKVTNSLSLYLLSRFIMIKC